GDGQRDPPAGRPGDGAAAPVGGRSGDAAGGGRRAGPARREPDPARARGPGQGDGEQGEGGAVAVPGPPRPAEPDRRSATRGAREPEHAGQARIQRTYRETALE